jgi:hypothetical protein
MNLDCSTRKSTNLPQELVKVRENNNGNQEWTIEKHRDKIETMIRMSAGHFVVYDWQHSVIMETFIRIPYIFSWWKQSLYFVKMARYREQMRWTIDIVYSNQYDNDIMKHTKLTRRVCI